MVIGANPVDAQVQVAVTTLRASGSSVLEVGLRAPVRKLLKDSPARIEGDMREALKPQTTNRDIQIKRVTFGVNEVGADDPDAVSESSQSMQVNLEYINLRALDNKVRTLQLTATPQFQVV